MLATIAALLLAQPTAAAAQAAPDTLLYSTFRTNDENWPTGTSGKRMAEMTSGGYHVRCIGSTPASNTSVSSVMSLNDEQDWSFEAKMRVQGRGGLQFGLESRGTATGDLLVFSLELDATPPQATLWHYDGHWTKEFTEPLPTGFDATAPHALKVAREGSKLRYYVDQQPLRGDTRALRHWPGTNHDLGFYVEHPDSDLLISQVLVRHTSRIRLAPDVPRGLRRERLANGISTPGEELSPRVSANGRVLFFSRSLGDPAVAEKSNMDIFVSERQADGSWGSPRNLGRPVNTEKNNTVVSTSPDGQAIVVNRLYDAAGNTYSTEGISESSRKADGTWTMPVAHSQGLSLRDAGDYTTRCIDASGQVAVVGADRESAVGQSDIYFSRRRPDGSWDALKSLGSTINTSGSEQAPFLAPDGKTLYFASNGHPGYGGSDIFVSKRLDDSWTKWSEPLNLGPGVNTPRYESHFTLPASGEYAYLISEESGAGPDDTDIYRLLLPPALRPDATVLVKGRVLDARTNQPIGAAQLRYEQLPGGQQVGTVRMAAAGTFAIALPAGQLYGFRAEAPGYLSASDNLDLSDTKAYGEVTRDLYLLPLTEPTAALPGTAVRLRTATGTAAVPSRVQGVAVPAVAEEKITLNNLFFVQGKPVLLPASFPELNRLAQTLTEHPGLILRIDGHTDNTGDAKDPKPNQVLSEQRAEAVRAYLVGQRIEAGRLSTRGYGGSQPVAPNDTEAHKAHNRRVEFVILKR